MVQFVDHGLDGGGLAGTGVAGEQNVGGGLAIQQGLGVVQNDLLLPLVVDEVFQTGLVGIAHRDDLVLGIDVEHVVLGVDAVTVLADVGDALVVAGDDIQLLHGKLGQIAIPVQTFPKFFGGQVRQGLEGLQLRFHGIHHLGPRLQPPADETDVGVFVVVDDALDVARQGPLLGVIEPGNEGGVAGHGLGHIVLLQTFKVFAQSGYNGISQQRPENGQGLEADIQASHTFRIAPFAPEETRAA